MYKTLLTTLCAAALATSAFAERTLFISETGGNWSDASAWTENGAATTAPSDSESILLRANGSSGILTIDTDATVSNISMWGKSQTISINEDKTFTVKSGDGAGVNLQTIKTVISGAGTFRGYNDTLTIYGGKAGASLEITSNALFKTISFNPSTVYYDNTPATVIFNASGSNSFTTGLVSGQTYYDKLTINGHSQYSNLAVKITGNATVGDIRLENNSKLIIDSSNFTMKGQWNAAEVNKSTLELVGGKGKAYNISAKVRLNGGSTLVLTGDNAYTNLVNGLFNYGDTNTLVVNGKTTMAGLCIYDKADLSEKVFKIELGEMAEGDDYLLQLTNLTKEAGNKDILATDSLTKTTSSVSGSESRDVLGFYIEFVNFDNGKVKLLNDLLTAEDWEHVRAAGWENFRLENGYITADKIPEPSTYAAIFGALALAFAAWRKRK